MITYTTSNIFDSKADCLVNPVNCFGVSGAGLALEFKNRYPKMFELYNKECKLQLFRIGRCALYSKEIAGKNILCFPTKYHYSSKSNLTVIERGLQYFYTKYSCFIFKNRNIYSVSFPQLGCGKGGLQWDDVNPLMQEYLSDLELEIYIHTRE